MPYYFLVTATNTLNCSIKLAFNITMQWFVLLFSKWELKEWENSLCCNRRWLNQKIFCAADDQYGRSALWSFHHVNCLNCSTHICCLSTICGQFSVQTTDITKQEWKCFQIGSVSCGRLDFIHLWWREEPCYLECFHWVGKMISRLSWK